MLAAVRGQALGEDDEADPEHGGEGGRCSEAFAGRPWTWPAALGVVQALPWVRDTMGDPIGGWQTNKFPRLRGRAHDRPRCRAFRSLFPWNARHQLPS
jgi:hypothetical protein